MRIRFIKFIWHTNKLKFIGKQAYFLKAAYASAFSRGYPEEWKAIKQSHIGHLKQNVILACKQGDSKHQKDDSNKYFSYTYMS
jgi:hypothetical protein